MKNHPNDKGDQNNKEQNSQNSNWREFSRHLYKVISPFFPSASGTLFVAGLGFYISGNTQGALAFCFLGAIFFIAFVFQIVKSIAFKSTWIKWTTYASFVVAGCLCIYIVLTNLFQSAPTIIDHGGVTRYSGLDSGRHEKPNPLDTLGTTPKQKPVFRPAKPATERPDTAKINIGSGSVVSFNQQGGITAGTINLNARPEIRWTLDTLESNIEKDGIFVSHFILKISSDASINVLRIMAHSASTIGIDASKWGGIAQGMMYPLFRDSIAAQDIHGAFGDYHIIVKSKKPDKKYITIQALAK